MGVFGARGAGFCIDGSDSLFHCCFACMRYRAEIFTFVYVMGVANAGVILVYLRKTEH